MFMAKMNITMRTELCWEEAYIECVIIYANGRKFKDIMSTNHLVK